MHPKAGRSVKPLTSLAAIALLILSAFAVSACSEATSANTWEQPNQNLQNTRYTGGRISTSTIANLGVAWTANQRTKAGFGSEAPNPLITQNNVFVQAPGGNFVGFNLTTGDVSAGVKSPVIATRLPSWILSGNTKVRDLASSISPILTLGKDDKPIAVGAARNTVVALGTKDGAKSWTTTLDAKSGTTPRVISNMAAAHEKIYVPVANVPKDVTAENISDVVDELTASDKNNGQLVALNASDGKVAWKKKLASVPLGAATVVNDVVFTSTLDGHVYGFNAGNGDEVWSSLLPAGAAAPIAAYSDTLIVPAGAVLKKGQKAQVVAFKIGGLGQIGGAIAPRIQQQKANETAAASEGQKSESAGGAAADGKALFTANCAGCHTLKDAGTSGTAGPNLDSLKPSDALVVKQVTNGGGAMPSFKSTLSAAEIAAIAKYVSSVAGK
ncbi:MAG: PQQ-binding-like beta-propeller repeat protein [Solirubrobacterales bacterium]